jgi:hypothetical protein
MVPAPSIGALAAMVLFPGTPSGKALFAAAKLWLLAVPVVWLAGVERRHPGEPLRNNGGWVAGWTTGIGLSALILLGYWLFGPHLIDRDLFAGKMRDIGLGAWPAYLGGAAYWILINSVLEEYDWRYFVYERCAELVRPAPAALLSAFFFTLHHLIALQTYFSLPVAVACSAGVFLGGTTWSLLYAKYRSIWPGYLSHALVDLTVFGIGAALLRGRP